MRETIDELVRDGAARRNEPVSLSATDSRGGGEDLIHGLERHGDENSFG
jgi:hypothetical protein